MGILSIFNGSDRTPESLKHGKLRVEKLIKLVTGYLIYGTLCEQTCRSMIPINPWLESNPLGAKWEQCWSMLPSLVIAAIKAIKTSHLDHAGCSNPLKLNEKKS